MSQSVVASTGPLSERSSSDSRLDLDLDLVLYNNELQVRPELEELQPAPVPQQTRNTTLPSNTLAHSRTAGGNLSRLGETLSGGEKSSLLERQIEQTGWRGASGWELPSGVTGKQWRRRRLGVANDRIGTRIPQAAQLVTPLPLYLSLRHSFVPPLPSSLRPPASCPGHTGGQVSAEEREEEGVCAQAFHTLL